MEPHGKMAASAARGGARATVAFEACFAVVMRLVWPVDESFANGIDILK
jgi:hypothetical protein